MYSPFTHFCIKACYGIDEIPSADEPWYCDRCEESPNDLKVVVSNFILDMQFLLIADGICFSAVLYVLVQEVPSGD